jgi:hypothetical protein
VFYIDASSVDTITVDFKALANAKDSGNGVGDALDWLADQDRKWLIVFNNADDTSLNLSLYFPVCSHGDILITTRNHHMINLARGIQAHCQASRMSFEDAEQLLHNMSHVESNSTTIEYSSILVKVCYACLPKYVSSTYICLHTTLILRSLIVLHSPSSKPAHTSAPVSALWKIT